MASWRVKSRVRFQIVSDLHLEVNQQCSRFSIPSRSRYLVLAGDIGCLRQYDEYLSFLQRHCSSFELILLVLGNHEFYGIAREEGITLASRLENEPTLLHKVKVLHRARVDIRDVVVLGCTLHSRVSPESKAEIGRRVNDFKRIQDWTVDDHNDEHLKDVTWLRQQVATVQKQNTENGTSRRILIVTHHAPVRKGSSAADREESSLSEAFASDVLGGDAYQVPWSGVRYWVFGHTHHTTQFICDGIKLVSNQRGYCLTTSDQNPKAESLLRRCRVPASKHTFDASRTIVV